MTSHPVMRMHFNLGKGAIQLRPYATKRNLGRGTRAHSMGALSYKASARLRRAMATTLSPLNGNAYSNDR
jgi:hypothetical protein